MAENVKMLEAGARSDDMPSTSLPDKARIARYTRLLLPMHQGSSTSTARVKRVKIHVCIIDYGHDG
jgi:hypothetical protein